MTHRIDYQVLPRLILRGLLLFVLTAFMVPSAAQPAEPISLNPVEVGDVRWSRDYPGALSRSKQTGKPLFLLFQEVPGCIGCQNFGQQVLTHPLLVEAIEDEFIPVLVYNNRSGGMDAELLKRFDEPSWNYQVVRFVDSDQRDIIPRRDRIWEIGTLAARMIQALEAAGRNAPNYLHAVAAEHATDTLETVAFAMFCFWTGEYMLGSIDGVITTEAGWYDGKEVTLVTYNPQQLSRALLIETAAARKCGRAVYIDPEETADREHPGTEPFVIDRYRRARASDQKKQIAGLLAAHTDLELTPMQETKLNALIPDDREAAFSWLSPRQKQKLAP